MITDKGHVIQELPIDEALPALISALRADGRAVLQAPPGAGKTTRIPLAMHKAELCKGRILMLEPRRLATRAAAERMAQTLGEKVGQTVGYRIRGESKVSPATRIEVVTEGILTRMIQSDSELNGVGAVIFDEFHERSLNADLGLALAWELRSALREDLILLVMSATLDAEPVAKMMANAPVITSEGRAFPVETYWLDRPISKGTRFDASVAALVEQAVAETTGGVLVFLPGEGEIRQVEARLKGRLPNECTVHPLFGAMSFAAQRKAIAPVREGRKIVLATAIAETSLTIEDIRVVVDGGRARRARFDAGSGMSRLVTERVTKAEAEQRKGRAGRVAKGQCYRHWTKGEEGGLQPFPPAEIQSADLSRFVLELALWGTADPSEMAFLTAPNPGAYAEAQSLLQNLGALDTKGRITPHGRRLATLPLHPRLAHMLARAGRDAALLAALLADRDPLARNAPVDLTLRAEALRDPDHFQATRGHSANRGTIERIKAEARRLASLTKPTQTEVLSLAEQAALAYPDRIGQRRKGEAPRWVLSGGKGAAMSEDDPLAGARFIVATDLDGDTREAKIRQAIEITEAEIRALLGEQIQWHRFCEWSKRDRRVVAREQERLGALILSDRLWRDAPDNQVARAALDGIADLGLPFNTTARRFQARAELVRAGSDRLPDMSDTALMDALDDWLLPHLGKARTAEDIKSIDLLPALKARLDWDQTKLLDQLAPSHFTTPLGNRIPVDYSGEDPSIEIRLQELFGLTRHPTVGPNRTPLRITLLSPARRPVQVTMDLPGFWAASYSDVRKDMRGRYPRHPWPEDPTKANPTLRAKRRGD
ncbi:ATP-dependent helicase HrpB [Pseudohalocynthiibacter sp. F2068]|jgi:ATP-dependent RNA helicase HrpB|uniref:ATP-dependent helicase HrpB n=1 Tax=Pseudohalocynthiibacter sp. F2068 TaxID=2926418 RepID=UPI001FF28A59|nr:ATP-dependent helicase HrpB [Pseudohalocynthiibacter sp. F2068]MCK0104543.1 ATP-dependent helicase HrpB [Pseudohalocynthiibacter sp. F2068]